MIELLSQLMLAFLLIVWLLPNIKIKYVSKCIHIHNFTFVGMVYSSEQGEFVQYLHLLGMFDVFSLQTRAIGWFVYLVVGCHSSPCRLGRHRRQPATWTALKFLNGKVLVRKSGIWHPPLFYCEITVIFLSA